MRACSQHRPRRACPPGATPDRVATELAIVGESGFETELALVRKTVTDEMAGIFGPASTAWRINREAAIFLAAGRALLMQLAHPWVAAAIADHSRSLADPIGRFHRTFGVVFAMMFGTAEQALAAARGLHRRHRAIGGTLAETIGTHTAGSAYRANDVAALRWVFATLAESAVVGYELVNPPLSSAERDSYFRDMRLFAALFGIPQAALPRDWPAFARYVETMVSGEEIAVGRDARMVADALFAGAGAGWRVPSWYRGLTANLLPPRLRDAFGMGDGLRQDRAARRALFVLRRLYRHLPLRLRYVAPYQEARARLAGRPPDRLTRRLNRLWIGRDSMAG